MHKTNFNHEYTSNGTNPIKMTNHWFTLTNLLIIQSHLLSLHGWHYTKVWPNFYHKFFCKKNYKFTSHLPLSTWGSGGALMSWLYTVVICSLRESREWNVGWVGCCKKKWPAFTVADSITSNETTSGRLNCK